MIQNGVQYYKVQQFPFRINNIERYQLKISNSLIKLFINQGFGWEHRD